MVNVHMDMMATNVNIVDFFYCMEDVQVIIFYNFGRNKQLFFLCFGNLNHYRKL